MSKRFNHLRQIRTVRRLVTGRHGPKCTQSICNRDDRGYTYGIFVAPRLIS